MRRGRSSQLCHLPSWERHLIANYELRKDLLDRRVITDERHMRQIAASLAARDVLRALAAVATLVYKHIP